MDNHQFSVTIAGIVEPASQSPQPTEAGDTVISIRETDDRIRIENLLKTQNGQEFGLKPGAEVLLTIKAEPAATVAKS